MKTKEIQTEKLKSGKHRKPTYEQEMMKLSRDTGMCQGLCIAIAHLFREHQTDLAIQIWNGAGLSIIDCQKYHVDNYDLDVIKANKDLF